MAPGTPYGRHARGTRRNITKRLTGAKVRADRQKDAIQKEQGLLSPTPMSLLSRVLHHHDKPKPAPAAARRSNLRFSLNLTLESPPIVLFGPPHESTGSIISGVLALDVDVRGRSNTGGSGTNIAAMTSAATDTSTTNASTANTSGTGGTSTPHPSSTTPTPRPTDTPASSSGNSPLLPLLPQASAEPQPDPVVLDSVVLLLVQTFHCSKPFTPQSLGSCKDCGTRKTVLAHWDILAEPAPFGAGRHAYPFSHLLPGLVAASTKLGSSQCAAYIKYDFVAVARAGTAEAVATLPLNVLRSVFRGADRNSLRVFPPTDVTALALLPSVMYPKSTFPIELRMDNVVNTKQDRRWRMRKLLWRLEEHTQVRAGACPKHTPKLKVIEDAQRRTANPPSDAARNARLHHLTVQTLMYMGRPPRGDAHVRVYTEAAAAAVAAELLAGLLPRLVTQAVPPAAENRDVVPEVEVAPPNRPADEAAHFDEDFGASAAPSPAALARLAASGGAAATLSSPEELFLDELRVVAHGDVKSGWKSDFLGRGRIELVAEISALACSTGLARHMVHALSRDPARDDATDGLRLGANISCDIEDDALGVYVGHVLVVEVIIAEEVVQPRLGKLASDVLTTVLSALSLQTVGVPTGAARVLRMQFKVIVSERSGLGIAWDDEVPPTYEDVRALSPPTYDLTPEYVGSTPSVLNGVGDTPMLTISHVLSLDENIQEFRL